MEDENKSIESSEKSEKKVNATNQRRTSSDLTRTFAYLQKASTSEEKGQNSTAIQDLSVEGDIRIVNEL